MNKIIKTIPIFPLNGALLLPGGNLPLNIFEPRYIAMVNCALSKDKIIGMIQFQENSSKQTFHIGCAGKISSFSETKDKRYLINLYGVSKFKILDEIKHDKKFRIFNVQFDDSNNSFSKFDSSLFNKKLFIDKINQFLKNNGMSANLESISKIDNKSLILMIAMVCPFGVNEKQMLLETKNINYLVEILIKLIDFSTHKYYENKRIN